MPPRRLNVTLDPEYAERLSQLAERAHVPDGTMARSLLSTAIDQAAIDGATMTAIIEGIPGIHEKLEHAEADVREGRVISLDELLGR